ncbi:MAG: hypothetical protein UR62_C0005G0009 [Candidatus Nomurabacteria bacterium GW2011_GWF2_35_12]|uniref:Uncharacterized protein n=3 Tax=Candidatus Nomuraibacteriota TaxID=1752729 RepID=A0A0G0EBJ0_9BACT|nr:MAG: hypothetical protein UR62_C0005G0009 [Candidatus Nomurabacteria bacterium GW2011_GWF2_35_12]KKP71932.1 MAG: hypothetical protein UR70_C0016G0009 [Candidatus Nomurabacteria bacterium GW2011_GWB1_35_20]KKP78258.1 MAG: hypothetical protein UR77_C0005G0033 [Candidatus Nomurabacteria bacterium GW2011_GWC2_35_35]KKP98461.1 MAG: hypothetical protein US05_C0003G0008 [Candidatus Nomurabacteria bacterium GW2011_GWA1_36_15]
MTGTTVPIGSILMNTTKETVQAVFVQKENIEATGMLAFNQVLDQEAKDLEVKVKAIDDYFRLHDMPLSGMGKKMVEESEKNDLDWRLLPAVAVRESTGGKYDCVKVKNNPFGWGSCKINFNSVEEAIETVAMNLGGNNPNTERHYADKTTDQILKAYNPPSIVPNYVKQVKSIMNVIGKENIILNVPVSSYVL